ncbi:MAG: hypothetical protein LBK66_02560 [Spirochaetaceae bacterium]|jgi:uncharacterized membrane protein|nr:hypothetical protein [Spirochaetaceae bacterium]
MPLPVEIIAEVVYVLGGVYGVNKKTIADKIDELMNLLALKGEVLNPTANNDKRRHC